MHLQKPPSGRKIGSMKKQSTTTKHLINLIEFRQAVYEQGLTRGRDAQFELVDALLASRHINSFVELSLSPVHRRKWPSAYAAIKQGQQDKALLRALFVDQLPQEEISIFSLDSSVWAHPSARTLEGLMYEHISTQTVPKGSVVKGHAYSLLGYVPDPQKSWALPLSTERIRVEKNVIQTGVEQIEELCQALDDRLKVFVGDGRYGNHRFLSAVRNLEAAFLVRLRCDRVLYTEPGRYQGRGRPRVHGERFAFKASDTWHTPVEDLTFEHARNGTVRLRRWNQLHAKQDSKTPFDVILAEIHLERDKPPKPIWLAYTGPPDRDVRTCWACYPYRWPVEPSFRFRKQRLHWTLPCFQQSSFCDRWTLLIDIAYWQVYLARHLVRDNPLPWQKALDPLTPGRVLQGIGPLFALIGTPATAPKLRGKSPGWVNGRFRTPPKRFRPLKRGKKLAQSA